MVKYVRTSIMQLLLWINALDHLLNKLFIVSSKFNKAITIIFSENQKNEGETTSTIILTNFLYLHSKNKIRRPAKYEKYFHPIILSPSLPSSP